MRSWMLYFLHMALGEVFAQVGLVALRDIFVFPVWWYTKGVVSFLEMLWRSARRQSANFAVGVWVKNLFVPMYGQYDWQGRVISFFVRLLQIIVRSLAYGIWLLVLVFVGVFYLVVPLVFLVAIFLHTDLVV